MVNNDMRKNDVTFWFLQYFSPLNSFFDAFSAAVLTVKVMTFAGRIIKVICDRMFSYFSISGLFLE